LANDREFDLPALIGAAGTTMIESGTLVEVEPAAGTIRVLAATAP